MCVSGAKSSFQNILRIISLSLSLSNYIHILTCILMAVLCWYQERSELSEMLWERGGEEGEGRVGLTWLAWLYPHWLEARVCVSQVQWTSPGQSREQFLPSSPDHKELATLQTSDITTTNNTNNINININNIKINTSTTTTNGIPKHLTDHLDFLHGLPFVSHSVFKPYLWKVET